MKNWMDKQVTIWALTLLMGMPTSYAQVWVGTTGGAHTDHAGRDGLTSIGTLNNFGFKLHVVSYGDNSHMAISGPSPSIRFNEGGSHFTKERANIGLVGTNGHYFPSSLVTDVILRAGTSTGNIIFGNGEVTTNSQVERMRIASNGNIGLGTLFTGASLPSSLLHLRASSSPTIFLEGNSGPTSGGVINFGYNGTSYYSLNQGHMSNGSTTGIYWRLGVTSSGKGITFQPTGVMAFSSTSTFGFGAVSLANYQGLSGKYIFDDQLSATKILVGPTSLAPYAAIPANYLFYVQGNSNLNGTTFQDGLLQINNTADLNPDKAITGLTLGNDVTTIAPVVPYSWIQSQESRPLALNPKPNANPSSANSSYVAIGFEPGTFNVPLHYKLAVKGKIICEEIKVKYAGNWSDYVFGKEYKLRGLKEVEEFIVENKHLPDVPSEADIKENGFESAQMDATLLRKIEELTLYMIEQNKKMDATNERLRLLELENKELKRKNRR